MPVDYIGIDEAIARRGLRMVVVGGVPSPWGEAAKGILHVKRIDWAAVRLAYDSEALKRWAGQRSGPVAIYDDEPPRAAWDDILLLAERLAPAPALLPADPAQRALVLKHLYSAAHMALFCPLPNGQCTMDPATQAALETCDGTTLDALDPILFEHRAMMYREHLELPLSL